MFVPAARKKGKPTNRAVSGSSRVTQGLLSVSPQCHSKAFGRRRAREREREQLTFYYLLGRGVVDLLLGGVGGKHLVEDVRLALEKSTTRKSQQNTKSLSCVRDYHHPILTSDCLCV